MRLQSGKALFREATARALAGLAGGVCLLTGCAVLPDDGLTATLTRFDGLRALRFCELLLIGGDALAQDLHAAIYNTTDLNGGANQRDTCPATLWDKVDTGALRQHYEVLTVYKSGPRYWTLDWLELPVGMERDFDGLQARWMGEGGVPKGFAGSEEGTGAYKSIRVAHRSAMGIAKGAPVFFLESPDGTPWVMDSYAGTRDPGLAYGDLEGLGDRLKLPPGWAYRVKILDKHLTIRSVEGHVRILQDDLENSYVACFETACSYTP